MFFELEVNFPIIGWSNTGPIKSGVCLIQRQHSHPRFPHFSPIGNWVHVCDCVCLCLCIVYVCECLCVYMCLCARVSVQRGYSPIDWLLEFYFLATSKVISGHVLTCDSAHSLRLHCVAPLRSQATGTMTRYPLRCIILTSHYTIATVF